MAAWNDVIHSAPEFAAVVQTLFDAHRNKLLATLRKDGSPRISAVEVDFVGGDLWLGMMFGSRKAHDLQRDPRFALHSASTTPDDDDPSKWPGDAKLSGLAVEITDSAQAKRLAPSPSGQSHLFRADIHEVVLTKVGDSADHLVIELWRENRGLRRFKRY
ncbi:pyridoxamine 5'-phosphate oxidase family protein [Streptosporangium sp. NPDC004631]